MNNLYNADKYFLVDTIHGNLKASNINLVPLSNALINLHNRRTFKVLSKKRIVDEITGLSISYVAAQENLEKFNKTRLRDNYPDIYDECIDMNGKRAAYITIRK